MTKRLTQRMNYAFFTLHYRHSSLPIIDKKIFQIQINNDIEIIVEINKKVKDGLKKPQVY